MVTPYLGKGTLRRLTAHRSYQIFDGYSTVQHSTVLYLRSFEFGLCQDWYDGLENGKLHEKVVTQKRLL